MASDSFLLGFQTRDVETAGACIHLATADVDRRFCCCMATRKPT